MINIGFMTFLGLVALVTVFFSMFNALQIRGLRNLGFLALYVGSIVWLFIAGLLPVLAGWCAFGIATGSFYYLYELASVWRSTETPKEWPSPTTVVHGLVVWPIMLPELIEYALVDIGVLKTGAIALPETTETDHTEHSS